MKYLLFLLLACSFSLLSKAQYPPKNNTYGVHANRVLPDSAAHIPRKYALVLNDQDTTPQLFVKGNSLYYYSNGTFYSVSGGVTIDTTSLSNRINGKVDTANLTYRLGNYLLIPSGTSAQYINGTGALATFPAIPVQVNPVGGLNILVTGSYPNYTFSLDTAGVATYFVRRKDSTIAYVTPTQLTTLLAGKVNISDTAAMLNPYMHISDSIIKYTTTTQLSDSLRSRATINYRIINIPSNVTINAGDDIVVKGYSGDGANYVYTLPTAASVPAGKKIIIGDVNGSFTAHYGIVVTANTGDVVNGASSLPVNYSPYFQLLLISDGISRWNVDQTAVKYSSNAADLDMGSHRVYANEFYATSGVISYNFSSYINNFNISADKIETSGDFSVQNVGGDGGAPGWRYRHSDGRMLYYGPQVLQYHANTDTTKYVRLSSDGSVTNVPIWYNSIQGAPTSLPPGGTAGGDLSGSYPNPSVVNKVGYVADISNLEAYTGSSYTIIVADSLRGGTFNYLTSATPDSGTVFPRNGSGYWRRQYNQAIGLSVLWFGAKGDYVYGGTGTDDAAAIQLAINSASLKATSVYFPNRFGKLYGCSNSIYLGQTTKLFGDIGSFPQQINTGIDTINYKVQSGLYFYNNTDGIKMQTDSNYRNQFPMLENLAIIGTGKSAGRTGVSFNSNPAYTGATNSKDVGLIKTYNCYFDQWKTGVDMGRADTYWLQFNHFSNSAMGIRNGKQDGRILSNCFFKTDTAMWVKGAQNEIAGNEIEPFGIGIVSDSATLLNIHDNEFKDITKAIVAINNNGQNFSWHIQGNTITNPSDTAIVLDSVSSTTLINNTIINASVTPIKARKSNNLNITNNTLGTAGALYPAQLDTCLTMWYFNNVDNAFANRVSTTGSTSILREFVSSGAAGQVIRPDMSNTALSGRLFLQNASTAYGWMVNNTNGLVLGYGANPGSTSGTPFFNFSSTGLGVGSGSVAALPLDVTGAGATSGKFSAGTKTALGYLDASDGGSWALIGGADGTGQTRTANTNKVFRFGMPSYGNSTLFTVLNGSSTTSANTLNWGGGTGLGYAATQHNFYAASTNTTTTGSVIANISNIGLRVGDATAANASAVLHVASTTQGAITAPVMTYPQWIAIASKAQGLMGYNTTTNRLLYYDGTTTRALMDTAYNGLTNANLSGSAGISIANGGTNSTETPTAGGAAYGTGTAYAFTSAGTSGQVLTSSGSGAPTWSNTQTLGSVASAGTTGTLSQTMTGGNFIPVTPTGNITYNAAGSPVSGATMTFVITTSGTSSFTITFGTSFKSTGTISTGTVSGKVFTARFMWDGTNWNEISRTTAM